MRDLNYWVGVAAPLAVALAVGCGGVEGRGDDSGSFTGLTNVTGTPTDGGGTATDSDDDADVGGTGVKLDVGGADSGTGPGGNVCEALVDQADVGAQPQDIIFVIDNS